MHSDNVNLIWWVALSSGVLGIVQTIYENLFFFDIHHFSWVLFFRRKLLFPVARSLNYYEDQTYLFYQAIIAAQSHTIENDDLLIECEVIGKSHVACFSSNRNLICFLIVDCCPGSFHCIRRKTPWAAPLAELSHWNFHFDPSVDADLLFKAE